MPIQELYIITNLIIFIRIPSSVKIQSLSFLILVSRITSLPQSHISVEDKTLLLKSFIIQ